MAEIRPFRALRYTERAGPLAELVAPPYDVIGERARATLASRSEANAIHLIRPEGEAPYRAAAERLRRWRERGWLARDAEPVMFLHAQRFRTGSELHERWGLLATLRLEPFEAGVVIPHERTLRGPREDRLRLLRECRTNLSPIFGLVDASLSLAELAPRSEPLAEFEDETGVGHRIWRLRDAEVHRALATRLENEPIFIADGHHRYEISLAFRDECRAREGTDGSAPRPYDFVLCHLVSCRDPGLVVLPTHRLLAEPPALEALLARWSATSRVAEVEGGPTALWQRLCGEARTGERPRLGIIASGSPPPCWHLEPGPGARAELESLDPALGSLEVTLLHRVILPEVPNERFLYSHDEAEAIAFVGRTPGAIAFLLPPPRVDDVLAISRARLTMPQKSTYFHPKVPTGIAFHCLDEE